MWQEPRVVFRGVEWLSAAVLTATNPHTFSGERGGGGGLTQSCQCRHRHQTGASLPAADYRNLGVRAPRRRFLPDGCGCLTCSSPLPFPGCRQIEGELALYVVDASAPSVLDWVVEVRSPF